MPTPPPPRHTRWRERGWESPRSDEGTKYFGRGPRFFEVPVKGPPPPPLHSLSTFLTWLWVFLLSTYTLPLRADRRGKKGWISGSYKEMSSIWPIAPSYTSPNAGGRGGGGGSQPMSKAVHITWHGARKNFGDLPPYITFAADLQGDRHSWEHPETGAYLSWYSMGGSKYEDSKIVCSSSNIFSFHFASQKWRKGWRISGIAVYSSMKNPANKTQRFIDKSEFTNDKHDVWWGGGGCRVLIGWLDCLVDIDAHGFSSGWENYGVLQGIGLAVVPIIGAGLIFQSR